MSNVREQRRQAFTLVELLVVIGIIALLVSILLPALSKAKKGANTTKCLSNLRQIGMAFQYYANENKDAWPVVRQDTPEVNGVPQNVVNRYWQDMIIPYLSKTGKMNFEITDATDAEMARKSVLWGCPEYIPWTGTGGSFFQGVTRFDNGYAFNHYPTASPTNPTNVAAMPPVGEWACRSTITGLGKVYKRSDFTDPARRMLVADAYLWLLQVNPYVGGNFAGQMATRTTITAGQNGNSTLDRYRHGKIPPANAGIYNPDPRLGRVALNLVYCDGHAETLTDYKQAYRAIRMRLP